MMTKQNDDPGGDFLAFLSSYRDETDTMEEGTTR
jgi:hypothetical protein